MRILWCFINGIDKEFLRSVYSRGEMGRRAFYQIISETSKSCGFDAAGGVVVAA